MVENLLSKMYIEGALMSKSRNIALTLALTRVRLMVVHFDSTKVVHKQF